MTREEKQKAIDALKISAPVIAVTQEEFDDYIQNLNKIMDWLEQEPKTGRCNACRWNDEDLIYNPQCENCCRNYHDNYESVNVESHVNQNKTRNN